MYINSRPNTIGDAATPPFRATPPSHLLPGCRPPLPAAISEDKKRKKNRKVQVRGRGGWFDLAVLAVRLAYCPDVTKMHVNVRALEDARAETRIRLYAIGLPQKAVHTYARIGTVRNSPVPASW